MTNPGLIEETNDDTAADRSMEGSAAGKGPVDPEALDLYYPDSPILSSGSAWEGLLVEAREGHHFPQRRAVPRLSDHAVYLHLNNPTALERWLEGGRDDQALVDEGDLTIVPAGRRAEWRWDTPIHVLQLYLPPELIRRVARETADVDPDTIELIPRFGVTDALTEQIGRGLLSELQSGPEDRSLYARQAAELLAVHLLREHCSSDPTVEEFTGGVPPKRLQRVKDYVEANLDGDIRLEDLAAEARMSQYHFSRQFKKSVGQSPSQYVIKRRIERGKRLLDNKDWLIARVAQEVGYDSQSSFTTQFKRRVGTTPSQYRNAP